MGVRRAIRIATEAVNVRSFAVLMARMMPPGRRRLEMVRLAHGLESGPELAALGRRAE
jgi:hypothetical protein